MCGRACQAHPPKSLPAPLPALSHPTRGDAPGPTASCAGHCTDGGRGAGAGPAEGRVRSPSCHRNHLPTVQYPALLVSPEPPRPPWEQALPALCFGKGGCTTDSEVASFPVKKLLHAPHLVPGEDLASAEWQLPPLQQDGRCLEPPGYYSEVLRMGAGTQQTPTMVCRSSHPTGAEGTRNGPCCPEPASLASQQADSTLPRAAQLHSTQRTPRLNHVFFSVASKGRAC